MLWKLRPGWEAGVVLANGSMSSNQSGEGQIREAMLRGETLFIDARAMGTMKSRVERVLTDDDIGRISGTVHAWRGDGEVEEQEEDDEPFDQKMGRLTALLKQQQDEGARLDQQIARNLERLGFE